MKLIIYILWIIRNEIFKNQLFILSPLLLFSHAQNLFHTLQALFVILHLLLQHLPCHF